MACTHFGNSNARMPRIPIIALISASLVTGILAVMAHAEWLVYAFLTIPGALWLSGSGQITSLRPIARTTTALSIVAILAVWSSEPDRRVMDRAKGFVPHRGDRSRTACVARIPSMPNRPVEARCLVRSQWVDLPLRLFEDDLPKGRPGALFWFTGTIQLPGSAWNPGGPDRVSLARRAGFAAWASITRRDTIAVLAHRDPRFREIQDTKGVQPDSQSPASQHTEGVQPDPQSPEIRAAVGTRLDTLLPHHEAGYLVRAMITGDRDRLSNDTIDAFRQAGISHVLAVSGLHVSIAILLVLIPVSLFSSLVGVGWTGRVVIQLLAVVLLLLLVVEVVGAGPSVVRASLFGLVVVAARLFDRSGATALSALFLSVALQVTWEPRTLFDAGFLLSHAAVAGLVHVGHNSGWVNGLRSSLFATWATSPFVALYFGTVPLAGIAANILAIPLTSVIVTAGTVSLLFDGIRAVAHPLATSATLAAQALITVSQAFADRFSFLSVSFPAGSIVVVSAAVLSLGLSRRGFMVSIVLLTTISLCVRNLPMRSPVSVTVLDVGQGDATVLSTPENRIAVIDAGPPRSNAVLNHLRQRGNGRIHALFLTHLHADHTGGLATISGRIPIDSLYVPAGIELPDSLLGIAAGIRRLRDGETVLLDREVRLRVLAPTGDETDDDPNASSLVLRIDHGETSILLTGDAERDSEETMASRWHDWLDVDMIKVAHHGSRTSSTPFFVERARPSKAVISAGFNSYGLPANEVIDRWKQAGALIHLTRTDGAFCLWSDGTSYWTEC